MTNPNSPVKRLKKSLLSRWSAEDYPGAEPRFQISLFGKDIVIFCLLPVLAVILFKLVENTIYGKKKGEERPPINRTSSMDASKSQIIDFKLPFSGGGGGIAGFPKRAPGSLVKLRLLNLVETYGTAPVHAQIVDAGLGASLMGGTLIGDAVPDTNFERINITFRFARDRSRANIAVPVTARALSLDGTLGVVAKKKEGYFTRSVLGSVPTASQGAQGKADGLDFQHIIIKALSTGLLQELGSDTQVERNRAQVLTLQSATEFFAELTDYFPGTSK